MSTVDLTEVVEYETEGHVHSRPDADWKVEENARPIRDRVLIQRFEPQKYYEGTDIEIPPRDRKKQSRCTVIATGPDVEAISEGDMVVVNPWSGEPVHHDGFPRLYVVLEEDIDAVLE